MNNADLYAKSHTIQFEVNAEILQQFDYLVNWDKFVKIKLLDIGCGDGDFLVNVLLKKLDNRCEVLGVDIFQDMVDIAAKKFGSMPNVKFTKFDITAIDLSELLKSGPFNLITSFVCLNWVRNQRQAFVNIYQLLAKEGQLFCTFVRNDALKLVYQELAKDPRWSPFMTDWNDFTAPYVDVEDWRQVLGEHLKVAGFTDFRMEVSHGPYHFRSEQELKDMLHSVNPFALRIPEELEVKYVKDLLKEFQRQSKSPVKYPYEMIILYASK
ncbi:juvenile hormone acid O-methyltransferase-like [Culex pipiens pallens]|uniref:juvenile hormone acid O-methyltransferase-like n=1 Tax=Culex pipiens pallens TaxID=42434 RepID=UPI001952C08C|nr:juvenile hormone acid O-methyltransferase-like [Culex pipiens pallens]